MTRSRILVFAGSTLAGSASQRLAALAAKDLALGDADVTRISLADYPLPMLDPEAAGELPMPAHAVRLKQMIAAHDGVVITCPTLNASLPPLLANALGWIARARERTEPPLAAFYNRAFALGATAADPAAGAQALLALRQILAVGCRATVIGPQVVVADSARAFDAMDALTDAVQAAQLQVVLNDLMATARARRDAA